LFVDFFELNASIAACLVLSLRFLYGYRSKVLLLVSAVVAVVCLRVVGDLDLDSALRTFQGRNFYGALSVREHRDAAGNRIRVLVHGRIVHGSQLLDGPNRLEPTRYYGRESGVGLALARPVAGQRVGIIGLGAGTLSAYGRTGDYYRFYEINPMVEEVARSRFT